MNPASAATAREKSAAPDPRPLEGLCPGCGRAADGSPLEVLHGSSLYACAGCDLHFWHPVAMPDAAWYETAYQGRDGVAMPLEPGHIFFLSDAKAPKTGRLLDLGCGVGNFLAAARDAGFDASGVEFNQNAVRFAQQHYGLRNVFALRPEDFRAAHQDEQFDVITFFEVLEHQQDPQRFLDVAKDCLAGVGFLALSVPNRDRWQRNMESLDYPPNHLTRWSPRALRNFLERNGFQILSMRQEPLGLRRAAQVLSTYLRTGMVSRVAGEQPPTLADLAEMDSKEMQRTLTRLKESPGHRWAVRLARWKNLALLPVAGLLLPYLRLRGRTGLYLYCLARRNQSAPSDVSGVVQNFGGGA
jgi:SAM-dependent methyltransferase